MAAECGKKNLNKMEGDTVKYMNLGKSELKVSAVGVGCMRFNGLDEKAADGFVKGVMDLGVNFFDHADIYGGGDCEVRFGRVLKDNPGLREKMVLQSKCAIVPGKMYDFSKTYILNSVDGILKRLGTDYLDVLVLHRPDALAEPEEVAEAFDQLQEQGKVRHFGVSNHNPGQILLLKKYVKQEILVDQLQFGLAHAGMISSGMEANMMTQGAVDHDGGVLDFCRLNDITIQTWSPFQYGMFEGTFIGSDKYPELNQVLEEMAKKYGITPTGVASAWILRHPAHMQLIAGTTKTERMAQICQGADVTLDREDWYKLYLAAGHILP